VAQQSVHKPGPSATTLRRLPLRLFVGVVIGTAAVSGLTCWKTGDSRQTWNVLIGTVPPPPGDWGWLYLILSALGYFAVPVSIGLVVTDAVARYVRGHQTDEATVEADTERRLNAALEVFINQRDGQ
jgi:hypothetical protein